VTVNPFPFVLHEREAVTRGRYIKLGTACESFLGLHVKGNCKFAHEILYSGAISRGVHVI
jgi:hypothetical protein